MAGTLLATYSIWGAGSCHAQLFYPPSPKVMRFLRNMGRMVGFANGVSDRFGGSMRYDVSDSRLEREVRNP